MRLRIRSLTVLLALCAVFPIACRKPSELTEATARQLIEKAAFKREPVYAEVPQKVWWSPKAPKDEYDERAVRTLRNLEREGLLTVTESRPDADSATYIAKVTKKGFPILGTAPSHRGPVYRAKIAEKRYDGLRNFVRHPTEPTVGHAELVWHYENPTPLYDLFETKIDKPLNRPFVSHVSFWWEDRVWKFSVNVRKVAASGAAPKSPQ